MNRRGGIAKSLVQDLGQQLHVRLGGLSLSIDGRMHLQQQLSISVGGFHRLIDQIDLRAHGDERKQGSDIFRVHADAPVGDGHADGHRVVGAVNHVRAVADGQAHRIVPERIVRSRLHYLGNRIAVLLVLLADRLRRIPVWMLLLGHDMRLAQGRVPVHLPDAHGESDDDRLLVLLRLRIVVEPVLRQVDDDAVSRAGRQNALPGQQDVLAFAGNPHIGARVGADDLLIPKAVAPSDVEQRVLVCGLDVLVSAYDRAAVLRQLVHGRPRGRAAEQHARTEQGSSYIDVHSIYIT